MSANITELNVKHPIIIYTYNPEAEVWHYLSRLTSYSYVKRVLKERIENKFFGFDFQKLQLNKNDFEKASPKQNHLKANENPRGHSNNSPLMSEEHSSPSVSSPSAATITTPTIQAPLQIPRTLQSTDLVNSLAFYEVTFIISTSGAIDEIRMDFPAGTGVGAAGIIERIGIGGGTLLKSGSSITYDVTTPVSIPAGTFIRLEMFGIKNPITPSTTFTADILSLLISLPETVVAFL